jgi:glycosyltransferase involved in cell wall biosynthesis
MRVLIDGQTLCTPEINRGIGKYFLHTLEGVLSLDFANDFYLASPDGADISVLSPWARGKLRVIEPGGNGHHGRTSGDRHAHYSDTINNLISKIGIDLYWTPNALMDNVFLPARRADRCRYCVTIFDLIPLVMEAQFRKSWPADVFARYRRKLSLLESDYDLFLHISQHTCADFTERLAVKQKQHAVTPLGVADSLQPYPFPNVVNSDDYVLYPGGFDPRKNMNGALEAFAKLQALHGNDSRVSSTRLRLVCNIDRASEKQIRKHAGRLGIADRLDLTGFVTEAALIELYQKARCLFFPSLYEGFGLPVLEGLACGLPIAASNTSSIPEVAGDLALYFDPYDVADMAEVLYQTLQQPRDLASRAHRHERARQFSWSKTAVATLNAWHQATEGPAVGSSATPQPGFTSES